MVACENGIGGGEGYEDNYKLGSPTREGPKIPIFKCIKLADWRGGDLVEDVGGLKLADAQEGYVS